MSPPASANQSPAPFLQVVDDDVSAVAQAVFGKVFRVDWSEPGFTILVLPENTDSKALRVRMVALKQALSGCYAARWGEPLEYLSLGRFDQQTTTKLHLDGAPEVSLLMLGYEPTAVRSELQIADYTRCARDLGLTPAEFLQQHNPMFAAGQALLEPCTTRLTDWQEERPRIVLINNSHAAPASTHHTAGVMHGAAMLRPNPNASRIINSTMIAPASFVLEDASAKEMEFLNTDALSGLL